MSFCFQQNQIRFIYDDFTNINNLCLFNPFYKSNPLGVIPVWHGGFRKKEIECELPQRDFPCSVGIDVDNLDTNGTRSVVFAVGFLKQKKTRPPQSSLSNVCKFSFKNWCQAGKTSCTFLNSIDFAEKTSWRERTHLNQNGGDFCSVIPQNLLFWKPGPLPFTFKPFHWRVQWSLGWFPFCRWRTKFMRIWSLRSSSRWRLKLRLKCIDCITFSLFAGWSP